ncbi:unnamed protein product [Spirodela intermedia]|uniref:Uncharacterized protein n=1 Tax=Spirodela intermedia TaxID=51605 RepID=A0A7I8KAN9_SPIIN|nr:unnamed protein product [Spirodela intermedia]
MEEEERSSSSSSSPPPPPPPQAAGDGGDITGETQESVFTRLRLYCLELLAIVRSPRRDAPFLTDMAEFLRHSSGFVLQPCLDYTLLPLLLLLDGATGCRSPQKAPTEGIARPGGTEMKRHVISDSVAEGVLRCLEELLSKCHLTSVDQMVMVLKKLAMGASLPSSYTSEEFREGIIRCVRVLLLQLKPCSSESCTCKQVAPLSTWALSNILQGYASAASKYHRESEDCLMAFLQSSNNSAAVGHWLSLLLQIGETEAERGLRGSAKLRKEAFLTLRILIAKVGTSDALAFFLPGVVSRLGKALYVNKSMLSGAAGSVESIDHGIRALSEVLVIVLRDQMNGNALEVKMDNLNELQSDRKELSQSVLETLRQLPVKGHAQEDSLVVSPINLSGSEHSLLIQRNADSDGSTRSFYVQRTKEWIEQTALHVDQLLSAVLPHLCMHPAEKVRQGVVASIRRILLNCSSSLKKSKLMLLECLCVLVCDDSEAVLSDAQEAVESLLKFKNKYFLETDLAVLFNRLIETFPRVVLGGEETIAVSHAQKLFALMYYVGPGFVADHLLQPPIKAIRFMEFLMSSFSQSSLYSGPLNNLILSKPLSTGYLHSIAELKAVSLFEFPDHDITRLSPAVPQISFVQSNDVYGSFELPRMPPWFLTVGSDKLYMALSRLLRLLGLAMTAEHRSDVSLSLLIDSPLECVRKLISEIRMKSFGKENWHLWYARSGSGQFVRQASTASCVINEMIYGTSDQSAVLFAKFFGKNKSKIGKSLENQAADANDKPDFNLRKEKYVWKTSQDAKEQVINCVGAVLHEYLSHEIWELPIDEKSSKLSQGMQAENFACRLIQVIIEGIGIFNISLGKHFFRSGFMQSSIYLLLQNLICSCNQVRSASDAVLRVVSTASGYPTVGHLVVSNADYVIDSLCRQLRHLDLNPRIPDVLSAMLSYIGAAHEILPLLEEPMRSISMELEVLGRNQHPGLTVPFLKAVREIMRASRREASAVSNEAESFYMRVKDKILSAEKGRGENGSCASYDDQLEYWEELLIKLNELKRYRRIVGSISESCLKPAGPLLASVKEAACLAALDIVEDGIVAISKVEDAYKSEERTKEAIERQIQSSLFQDLQDITDASDGGGTDENRLLPMMNKIWPYLVLCMKNRTSVAVIRRCTRVISTAVHACGGDFFIRRFRLDGSAIWNLLASSPFQRKPPPAEGSRPILLPYRAAAEPSSEDQIVAEASAVKTQEAVLNLISEISADTRSAAAVEAVLKRVAGLVVGIACSGVADLREAAVQALAALARVDSDLIWLLLADVVYSNKNSEAPPPPPGFPWVSSLLPPPPSPSELLHLRYGGGGSGFRVDPGAAEIVFKRMLSEMCT